MALDSARLVELLERYDPADPERDLDYLQTQFPSTLASFSTLAQCASSTSLAAMPLLLKLDFDAVVADAVNMEQSSIKELERWIGFLPERMRFSTPTRLDWFKRFATASVRCGSVPLVCKLLRLGQCTVLADCPEWTPELFASVVANEPHANLRDALLLALLTKHGSRKVSSLLLLLLRRDALAWVQQIVLNRNCLAPSALFALLESVHVDLAFLTRVARVWSEEAFITRSTVVRHAQVSGVIRYCLARVKQEPGGGGEEDVTTLILRGVQHHLACNIAEKRVLGMIVAEEFTNVFSPRQAGGGGNDGDATPRLDFGDDRSAFVDEYNPQVVLQADAAAEAAVPGDEPTDQDEDDDAILSWPWPANPFHFNTGDDDDDDEEDGQAAGDEDDDACSLEPYDISEDTQGLVVVPKLLSQIPALLCSDAIDSVQLGLENLPLLVRANAHRADTRRRAVRLMMTLLELDNKFDLTQFDALRHRGVVALIVCVPAETGPALARAIYSRNLTLGTKMVALESLAEAVKTLADGGFKDEEGVDAGAVGSASGGVGRSLSKLMTAAARPNQHVSLLLSSSSSSTQVGTVTKRSAKLTSTSTTTSAPRENKLAAVAWRSFFSPLCSRLADFEREPMLLCKVTACLALVLERSKHAGGEARRMAEEFIRVLPWLKFRTEAEIQRAVLYSLASIVSVAVDLLVWGRGDWLQWVEYLAHESQDEVSREMAQRVGAMLITAHRQSATANSTNNNSNINKDLVFLH